MVKVYYPAKPDDSKPFSPYFHSPELVESFAAFYNLPGYAFDHLSLVKTDSKEGLEISDGEKSYPVVLFSHGAGTSMEVQVSQSEDLASHGYIVVNIDHTYVSAATFFPDGIVSHKDATTDFNIAEPAAIITQIMADDSSFVIDKLTEMNEGKISSIFRGRLDVENIGAIGHSVGGAVAYNLALTDRQVRAAIDLDGVVFITPQFDSKTMAPFLMLANDRYHVQAIQNRKPLMKEFEEMDQVEQKMTMEIHGSEAAYHEAYDKALQNITGLTRFLEASGNLFTIQGSDHMKFIDIGLFIGINQLRERMGIGGKTDPARCLEITKAVTLAFFDQHLRGESNDSLESLIKKYPELKRVALQ
jgi:dienelactone hydrolase